MKTPRVKEVLRIAATGGPKALRKYFGDENVVCDPNTWSGKIKKLLDEKKDASVMAEIELMIIEFNFFNNDKKDKTTGNGEK
jgi:hypothetical protein